MKKWYILTVVLLLIALVVTACGQKPAEAKSPERNTEVWQNVLVGISVGETGYYSTQTKCAELSYYDGKLTVIEITDPTLLAFQVSEYWFGGVRLYHNNSIESVIDELKRLNETYQSEDLQDIIDELERGLLLIEAST